MAKAVEYTLLITDAAFTVLGDPILCWQTLDVVLRFNEPGSGMFTCPGYAWILAQVGAGNRVMVVRNQETSTGRAGDVLLGGPIESWLFERGDDGDKGGDGVITVNFADDLAFVVARQMYPDSALAPAAQTTDRWQYTGNAELGLRTIFDRVIGFNSLTARKNVKFGLGALASVGSNVTVDADRMAPVGELMRDIARVGGGLGFRMNQTQMTGSVFQVFQPQDKSTSVRFGFGLGNLEYLAYEVKAPTATTAIVGGQGEGADRALIERVNTAEEAAWGRMETLVSRPGGSDLQSLQDDGDKALADGASTTRVASNVRDTDDQQFGVHYNLGDKVSIETFPGQSFSDVVMTVHIQAWPTAGQYVSATIGSQAAKTAPIWQQRLDAINQRLGQVERNVKPAVRPA